MKHIKINNKEYSVIASNEELNIALGELPEGVSQAMIDEKLALFIEPTLSEISFVISELEAKFETDLQNKILEVRTRLETAKARQDFKGTRQELVNNIKVTTIAGNIFDGDENSQTRMSRAISVMDDIETTTWVLSDNSVIQATKAELKEALKLAGQEQTRIWIGA